MSITSETQRKYDPNKGGFSYYTLFHADKGERPTWAQDGDMLEEFGEGGKAYVCSRDAKGRIKWTEKADWDRQTGGGSGGGSGGGGGAEPFYVEATITEENDEVSVSFNKTLAQTKAALEAGQGVFLVFDGSNYPVSRCGFETGDEFFCWLTGDADERAEVYMSLDEQTGDTIGYFEPIESEKGGGAEKFVVTLTKSGSTWTSDKTIAEIVAAVNANKVVECYAIGLVDYPLLLVPSVAVTAEGVSIVGFYGAFGSDDNYSVRIIVGTNQGGSDYFFNTSPGLTPEATASDEGKVLMADPSGHPVWAASNAPLIVTMTEDQQTPGTYNGDKTCSEILTAMKAGKVASFILGDGAYTILSASNDNGSYLLAYLMPTGIETFSGQGSDYPSITIS